MMNRATMNAMANRAPRVASKVTTFEAGLSEARGATGGPGRGRARVHPPNTTRSFGLTMGSGGTPRSKDQKEVLG
jgi:hypothetical protein